MKRLRYSTGVCSVYAYLAAACLWILIMSSGPASGADAVDGRKGPDETEAIQITSDRLIADKEASYAEFAGNVRATQGNTVVTADSLRIYYRGSLGQNTSSSAAQDAVEKIVASGNVKILFDGRVAESDRAVYTSNTRILVLSGAKSKVTSGKNSVSGKTITVERNDDRITVEGGKETRVEAVIFSGKNGLN